MTAEEKLEVIISIASKAELDDTIGDFLETTDTILWIATDGQQGKDWGCR